MVSILWEVTVCVMGGEGNRVTKQGGSWLEIHEGLVSGLGCGVG